jgi:Cupin domain
MSRAIVRADGEGTANSAFHLPRRLLLTAADTAGSTAVWIEEVPPGAGPPLHIHAREDESFYVLDGMFRFKGGETVELAFHNDGAETGRLLVTMTPGGFEGFFLAVEAEGLSPPEDMARIGALAAQYGLSFVGPPL